MVSKSASTTFDIEIDSQFLQEKRKAIIYLPPNYSPLYSYPVLYAHDGFDYIQSGKIIGLMDQKIIDEEWRPFILVAVPVERRNRTPEYFSEGDKHTAYLRFFAEELVPYIDKHYATDPMASQRAVIGDSLAAHVAIHLSLDYPHMVGTILSQSGFFDPPLLEKMGNYKGDMPIHIYMVVGSEETNVKTRRHGDFNILEWNRKAYDVLKNHPHYIVDYHEYKGDHDWGFWQNNLPEAIGYYLKQI